MFLGAINDNDCSGAATVFTNRQTDGSRASCSGNLRFRISVNEQERFFVFDALFLSFFEFLELKHMSGNLKAPTRSAS